MAFEVLDPDAPTAVEVARRHPVAVILLSVESIIAACQEGKQTTNHTDWGRLQEIQRLAERMSNICAVMQSERPSGVGRS